ncbi:MULTISPECIES: hypothetical protein [Metallibacterium]|uniref:hypothetical protein n=1 Tax=Metallibacterium TaxID=1218803 RepID=UPI002634F992|nr:MULTISPECIES: hypothetical protein [Metallibacterium]MBW8075341.1 hypothetical protein [Metallibacterium scheffleri]
MNAHAPWRGQRWALLQEMIGRATAIATFDQFAKPGILPPDSKRPLASKPARQSRATFVATSICVLIAAAHTGAGALLQTTHS